jgi:hypothetical protein
VSRRAPGRRPPLRPDLPRSARGQGTEVRAQHDVRVQHLEQRLEVAVPCGRQKGVDDFVLSVEGGVGNRVLALDSATRAAGELTCRLGRAVDDRRDLVEGQGEMSCSTNASRLDGLRLEHDEQRQADRVRQQRLVLGVDPVGAVDDRVRHVDAERLLAPHLA